MNQDQPTAQSPFSALSYQEQQNRWLEWRSRQLDYRPAGPSADSREEKRFYRENTGYYHVTAGPMEQKFILPCALEGV